LRRLDGRGESERVRKRAAVNHRAYMLYVAGQPAGQAAAKITGGARD
jgi:hypothetical protein